MVAFVERDLFKIVQTNIQKAIKEWNADQNNIYTAQYITPLWVGNNEEADTNANQIKVDRSDAYNKAELRITLRQQDDPKIIIHGA